MTVFSKLNGGFSYGTRNEAEKKEKESKKKYKKKNKEKERKEKKSDKENSENKKGNIENERNKEDIKKKNNKKKECKKMDNNEKDSNGKENNKNMKSTVKSESKKKERNEKSKNNEQKNESKQDVSLLGVSSNGFISDELTCDSYTKIYSISRGPLLTPPRETSTPLPAISMEPKVITVNQLLLCTSTNIIERRSLPATVMEKVIEADVDSPFSSGYDFEDIKGQELLWAPSLPRPKIFGFDLDGNQIEEPEPPRLSYGFAHVHENRKNIFEKLIKYRDFKNTNQQAQAKDQKSLLIDTPCIEDSLNKTKSCKEYPQPCVLETAEEYSRNIKENKIKWTVDARRTLVPRIRRKIEQGSYPNLSVDEESLPTLLRYTWKGKLMKIRKYLQNKNKHSKINRRDDQGRTALHYTASWACDKTMRELLNVPGINLNAKDSHGMTPLFKAVQMKSLACVKLLVERGVNISITCQDGRDVIDYIIQECGDAYIEILEYLLTNAQLRNEHGNRVMTCLHKVCLAKKIIEVEKTVELLIAGGANVDAIEGKGRTPLMLAILNDRTDIVQILLKNFADVRIFDDDLKNALTYAKSNKTCYNMLADCYNSNNKKVIYYHLNQDIKKKDVTNATKKGRRQEFAKVTPIKGGEPSGIENKFDKEYITNLFLASKYKQ